MATAKGGKRSFGGGILVVERLLGTGASGRDLGRCVLGDSTLGLLEGPAHRLRRVFA